MNIHEYQAKAILSSYNIKTPKGEIAFNADEAAKIAQDLGGKIWVVKSQIHAGGRGKGGGVKFCPTKELAIQEANNIFGMNLQ